MLIPVDWGWWVMVVLGLGCVGAVVYVARRAAVATDLGSGKWWGSVGVFGLWLGLAFSLWSGMTIAVSSPSLGQEGAAKQTPAAIAREKANDELDRLRREIRMLTELRDAQQALKGWNELRVQGGEPETFLDSELCGRLRAWCVALPGTFGPAEAGGKRK